MKIENEKLFNNENDRFFVVDVKKLMQLHKKNTFNALPPVGKFLGLKLISLLAQVSLDSGQAISWR